MPWKKLFPSRDSPSSRKTLDVVAISAFFRKNKWLIFLCLLSVILLLFFCSKQGEKTVPESGSTAFCSEALRRELEATLSEISGVGKCSVFITYSDGGETVYAMDENASQSNGKIDSKRQYVLVSSRSSGLVLKVYTPSVQGVAVVCQGGDSTRVKNDVTEVLSRTLGISGERISVKKMNP